LEQSQLRLDGAEFITEAVAGAEVVIRGCVGEAVAVVGDEAGAVWEQDVRTMAALRPTAAVRRPCQGVLFVTLGSLGRFV
jgi:hypothetical protein